MATSSVEAVPWAGIAIGAGSVSGSGSGSGSTGFGLAAAGHERQGEQPCGRSQAAGFPVLREHSLYLSSASVKFSPGNLMSRCQTGNHPEQESQ